MSGHSKWSTIKRQKTATDAKRGQLFTKLSNAITLAVRQGGGIGDPSLNLKLRLAVDAARKNNMPKENIERAIAKASGSSNETMQEVMYEGFGPGGFSVIVEAVTDNKLRTNAEIKNLFEKHGGRFGNPGSVSYQYASKGLLVIEKAGKTFDELFLFAVESGVEDVEDLDQEVLMYTKPEELTKVREQLLSAGLVMKDAKLIKKPLLVMSLSEENTAKKAISFTTLLEDHQDVQEVFTNFAIPDSFLSASPTGSI